MWHRQGWGQGSNILLFIPKAATLKAKEIGQRLYDLNNLSCTSCQHPLLQQLHSAVPSPKSSSCHCCRSLPAGVRWAMKRRSFFVHSSSKATFFFTKSFFTKSFQLIQAIQTKNLGALVWDRALKSYKSCPDYLTAVDTQSCCTTLLGGTYLGVSQKRHQLLEDLEEEFFTLHFH